VLSNVGLFYEPRRPPLSPDVMLSLRTPPLSDMSLRENRSYFVWVVGKVPDVIIEVVSDRTGGEGTYKLRQYAGMAVPYYVIYDPQVYLRQGVLRAFELNGRDYQPTSASWFARVGLGLVLWQGSYEGVEDTWLRWCDEHGQVIPTGRERSDEARQQAERERQRAERLAAQLRALGIDPSA
jgi:Uma2 family endonuclease